MRAEEITKRIEGKKYVVPTTTEKKEKEKKRKVNKRKVQSKPKDRRGLCVCFSASCKLESVTFLRFVDFFFFLYLRQHGRPW